VEKARLALGAVEDVLLLDLDHRQPAALCTERIPRPRRCLFLDEQRIPRRLPLSSRDDSWKSYLGRLHRAFSSETVELDRSNHRSDVSPYSVTVISVGSLLVERDRAVLHLSGPLVSMDDDASAGRLGIDQTKSRRHAPGSEETLTAAQNHWK